MSLIRPTWDEYFIGIAKLAATRSTCISLQVGAVIVKDNQIVATGYNGPGPGSTHCTEQGYCYKELMKCTDSSSLPSRATHAEANAIAQAAKHGIATYGATIYITSEPCITCLKLIIAAGIKTIYYEKPFNTESNLKLIEEFVKDSQIQLTMLS